MSLTSSEYGVRFDCPTKIRKIIDQVYLISGDSQAAEDPSKNLGQVSPPVCNTHAIIEDPVEWRSQQLPGPARGLERVRPEKGRSLHAKLNWVLA